MVIIAVIRVGYELMSALKACRNWRRFSGWQASAGYIVGLSIEGITKRWTVVGELESTAVCSRRRTERNGDSIEGLRGMNDMLVMEG